MMNMYFVISVLPFWQPSNVEETLNVTRDIKLKIILLMQFVEEEERKKKRKKTLPKSFNLSFFMKREEGCLYFTKMNYSKSCVPEY